MRTRTVFSNEAKCNFCFQWIHGPNLNKKNQNICQQCLISALNDQLLVNSASQSYRMLFLSHQSSFEPACPNKSILLECADQMMSIQLKQVVDKWNDVKKCLNQSQNFNQEEKRIIQSKLQEVNEASQCFHGKTSYLAKDAALFLQETVALGPLFKQSPTCKGKFNKFTDMNRRNKQARVPLGDIDTNTEETLDTSIDSANGYKYDYYFDRQAILNYKSQNKPSSFNEFDLNIATSLFLNLNRQKPKTNRSNYSQNALARGESKDQLKSRIVQLMADKHYSDTYTRMMTSLVLLAFESTKVSSKSLELISYDTSELDIAIYLNLFDFERISVIKLVNVSLTDPQLKILLQFIWNKKIQNLVLTGNKLTENCLGSFLSRSLPFLKEIYLGKNRIYKYRVRSSIMEMRSKFTVYL